MRQSSTFPWRPAQILAVIGAIAFSVAAEDAPFVLSLDPCAQLVRAPAGAEVELVRTVLLTPDGEEPLSTGAQGWSLSLSADGVEIIGITTAGTLAAPRTADPPGLWDRGFERSTLTLGGIGACADRHGAVSAVVLSIVSAVTLPLEGSSPIARLTLRGRVPGSPESALAARLRFLDGCGNPGSPLGNVVTWMDVSNPPGVVDCSFELAGGDSPFRRGDVNGDQKIDISDPIAILGCKFLGERCPTCRDAGDANDDGLMDLSDAVRLLGFLFLGAPPPPAPGMSECGTDPTDDALPSCLQAACL